MTYHLKPRRKKSLLPVVLGSIFVFVMVCIHLLFPSLFVNIISFFGVPLMRGENVVNDGLSGVGTVFTSKEWLLKHTQELEDTIAAMKIENDHAKLLAIENAELKNLLGRGATTSRLILGAVLARPPQTAYDSLLVDLGSDSGIAVGDRVIVAGSVPIGTVAQVESNFSKVVLYSSAGESLSVIIGTSTQATAEALGSGSFKVKIPREVPIIVGDPVAIPSIRAELFGSVVKVDVVEGDAFKYVFFQNPVAITELRFIQVEKVNQKSL
jgi:cell shape-determining protein MreC